MILIVAAVSLISCSIITKFITNKIKQIQAQNEMIKITGVNQVKKPEDAKKEDGTS